VRTSILKQPTFKRRIHVVLLDISDRFFTIINPWGEAVLATLKILDVCKRDGENKESRFHGKNTL
jgi:hypothetical protein